MASNTIITSLFWVKKGWARSIPLEYEEVNIESDPKYQKVSKIKKKLEKEGKLTGTETIKESAKLIEEKMNVDEEDLQAPIFSEDLKNYYLKEDNAENNNDNNEEMEIDEKGEKNELKNLPDHFDDISDEEQDDYTIHPTDSLIVCGTAQDDFSNLEVYIYDENTLDLFVHHDIALSAFPLSLEWIPFKNNMKCNYALVGSFTPGIEVWNLDIMDAIEPEIILGLNTESKNKIQKNISDLEEIYPFASGKSKENEAFKAAAMEATFKLQSGVRGYRALWNHIINVSVTDLKRNYNNLNVEFDLWNGESTVHEVIPGMVSYLKDNGYAHLDQGALVVDVKEETDTKEIPPCMILKSDGASLYNTTDLATIMERMRLYNPAEIIYDVAPRLSCMEDFLPQRTNSAHGRHNCSKYHCCASLCGWSSAVDHADVRRNNADDSAAMLSPERCRRTGFWIPLSQIWHSVFHDGTRRGTYRMEDHLDHFVVREIQAKARQI